MKSMIPVVITVIAIVLLAGFFLSPIMDGIGETADNITVDGDQNRFSILGDSLGLLVLISLFIIAFVVIVGVIRLV